MSKKLIIYNNQPNAPKPNKPLIPGTCAVLVGEDKKILLHRRADNDSWALPGGQMKLGESISECILRELNEELKIKAKIIKLSGVYTSPKVVFKFPNGDIFQSFVVAFLCETKNKKIILNNESIDFRWTELDELNKLHTMPFVKKIVKDALTEKYSSFD